MSGGARTAWSTAGSGPPVVLLHGLGLDHRMWRRQVPMLARAGYRVVACDLLGHGGSGKPSSPGSAYSVSDLTASLVPALSEAGVGPATVVGFSLGGAVALQAALSAPERVSALVLANTSAWMGPQAQSLFTERAAAVEAEGVEVLVEPAIQRWFTPEFVASHAEDIDYYMALLRQNHAFGYAAACRSLAIFDLRNRLGEIRCPTMVVVGDRDQATPPEMSRFLAERIPGATLHVMGPSGHLTPEECAGAFNERIAEFLCAQQGRVGR